MPRFGLFFSTINVNFFHTKMYLLWTFILFQRGTHLRYSRTLRVGTAWPWTFHTCRTWWRHHHHHPLVTLPFRHTPPALHWFCASVNWRISESCLFKWCVLCSVVTKRAVTFVSNVWKENNILLLQKKKQYSLSSISGWSGWGWFSKTG